MNLLELTCLDLDDNHMITASESVVVTAAATIMTTAK